MRYLNVNPGQSPDYIIVGLGNPGFVYENTRQNVGFKAIEYVESRCTRTSGLKRKFQFSYCDKCLCDGCLVYNVKPNVQMNNAGISVQGFLDYYGLPPERLIVIYDDVTLPIGQMRFDFTTQDFDHKGIKSIHQYIGKRKFMHIRVGIGDLPEDMDKIEFLLSHFSDQDEKLLQKVFMFVYKAIYCVFNYGVECTNKNINNLPSLTIYENNIRTI